MAKQDDILKRANKALQQIAKDKAAGKTQSEADRKALMGSLGEDILDVLHPLIKEIAENSKVNKKDIEDALKSLKIPKANIQIDVPPIEIPPINIPDVVIPRVVVPRPEVTVNVPKADTPIVNIPETKFPDSMNVNINGVSKKNPLSVILRDLAGKPVDFPMGASGGKADFLTIKGFSQSAFSELQNQDGRLKVSVEEGAIHSGTVATGGAQIMAEARTTNPTAVSDGEATRVMADDVGRQVMRPIQVRDLIQTAYVEASSEGPKTLLAGVGSTYHDLISVMCANSSDAAITLDFTDTTGASVPHLTVNVPANGTAGVSYPTPLPQTNISGTWQVDNNAADHSNTIYAVTALFSKEV